MAPPQSDIIKPDLTITWDGGKNNQRTALVLTADERTSLGALVQLLVDHWDLPVWSEKSKKPLAYDLCTPDGATLDLAKKLGDAALSQAPGLRLVAANDRFVLAQSAADLAIFEVWHPDSKESVAVLVLPGTVTVGELQERLEGLWKLSLFHNQDFVHYELWARNKALPKGEPLPETGADAAGLLAFVRKPGAEIEEMEAQDPAEVPDEARPRSVDELDIKVIGEEEDELKTGQTPALERKQAVAETQVTVSRETTPPTTWDYLDFELQIFRSKNRYQAEVLASPAGEALEMFVPPKPMVVENFILRVSRTRQGMRSIGSPAWLAARDFGQDLFRRLFHGGILACLTASIQKAQEQDCGLRIKLRLDKVPELMNMPWEFLYHPSRRSFLAPQEDTPIVRFLNVSEQRHLIHAKLPLRILAMVASPTDLDPLGVDEEREKLSQALQPLTSAGMATIDWIDGGSMSALHQHLMKAPERHHIFHFIGHGGFEESSGEGFLAMEGAGRRFEAITGEHLAPLLLSGKRRFRLAVLNACEGARSGAIDPFAGVATSLVLACGLPAVVAMQFEITDAAAISFASNFYAALATGRPVDTAVTAARLAIWASQNDVEWATPVLYMRSPDGRLFDFADRQTVW